MGNSNNTISADNFSKELLSAFKDYSEDVTQAIEKAVDQTAKEAVKETKKSAPNKTGKYSKSFAQKKGETQGERIVYSKDRYQLTHLLEHGHAKRNGGRTKPIQHLGPARDKAVETLEKQIEDIIKKGG